LNRVLQRGIWNFSLDDISETNRHVELDNGMEYDVKAMNDLIEAKKQFHKERSARFEAREAGEGAAEKA